MEAPTTGTLSFESCLFESVPPAQRRGTVAQPLGTDPAKQPTRTTDSRICDSDRSKPTTARPHVSQTFFQFSPKPRREHVECSEGSWRDTKSASRRKGSKRARAHRSGPGIPLLGSEYSRDPKRVKPLGVAPFLRALTLLKNLQRKMRTAQLPPSHKPLPLSALR